MYPPGRRRPSRARIRARAAPAPRMALGEHGRGRGRPWASLSRTWPRSGPARIAAARPRRIQEWTMRRRGPVASVHGVPVSPARRPRWPARRQSRTWPAAPAALARPRTIGRFRTMVGRLAVSKTAGAWRARRRRPARQHLSRRRGRGRGRPCLEPPGPGPWHGPARAVVHARQAPAAVASLASLANLEDAPAPEPGPDVGRAPPPVASIPPRAVVHARQAPGRAVASLEVSKTPRRRPRPRPRYLERPAPAASIPRGRPWPGPWHGEHVHGVRSLAPARRQAARGRAPYRPE